MKKLLACLLALIMVLSMTAGLADESEHILIYGASTEISGDFAPSAASLPMSSPLMTA